MVTIKKLPISSSDLINSVKLHVQLVAASKGYDSPEALQSYANSTVPLWRAEASAFSLWRDACWQYVYEQIALWENDERTIEAADELVGELDEIVWPTAGGLIPQLWSAAYNIEVASGAFNNITQASHVSGAIYFGTGLYYVFLDGVFDPDRYFPFVWDDLARMRVTEKTSSYFVITTIDGSGEPLDPNTFSLEITRFV